MSVTVLYIETVSCYYLSHDEGHSQFKIMPHRALLSASILLFFATIYLRKQEETRREKLSHTSAFSLKHMGTENEFKETIPPVM